MAVGSRPLGRAGLVSGPLSFGAAVIGNLYSAVSPETASSAVASALDSGVTYFDTAPHYGIGLSERRLGAALRAVPRDSVTISTKVGRLLVPNENFDPDHPAMDAEGFDLPATHRRVRDYSRDGVLRSLEASLERLGTDRIDIVFVHDPDDHYREAMEGAFPALAELRDQGVIRSFGAGMNGPDMLADFVRNTDLDVVMLAGRYTLLDQAALDDLLPGCVERGVSLVAAGVFNSDILALDRPAPDAHFDYLPAPAELVERANRIADVCERHGTTLPSAAAWFPLGHPAVATVCIGARTPDQVVRNASLFEHPVPDDLWAELVAEGLLRKDVLPAMGVNP